jgi:hypothetical protein
MLSFLPILVLSSVVNETTTAAVSRVTLDWHGAAW